MEWKEWLTFNRVGNGIFWIVGSAMQIGGWINQRIAIALLVVAFIWTIISVIYHLLNKRGKITGLD